MRKSMLLVKATAVVLEVLLFMCVGVCAQSSTDRFPLDIYTGPMNSGSNEFAETANPYSPWSYYYAQASDMDGSYPLAVVHNNGLVYAYAADVSGRGYMEINTSTGVFKMYPYFDYDAVVAWKNSSGEKLRLAITGNFSEPANASNDGQNVYIQRYNSTLGTETLFSYAMPVNPASTVTKNFNVEVVADPNDYISFRNNRGPANDYSDGVNLETSIVESPVVVKESLTESFPSNVYTGPMNSGSTAFGATANPYSPWSYHYADTSDNDGSYSLAVVHNNGTDYAYAEDVSGRGLMQVNTGTGVFKMYPYYGYDAVVGWRNTTGVRLRLAITGNFSEPANASNDGQNVYIQRYNSTLGNETLFSYAMPVNPASTATKNFKLEVVVDPNDYIYFRNNRGPANDYSDGVNLTVDIVETPYSARGSFPHDIYDGPMESGAKCLGQVSNPYLPWTLKFAQENDYDGIYSNAVVHNNGCDYAYAANVSGRGYFHLDTSTGLCTAYPYYGDGDPIILWKNTTGHKQKLTVAGTWKEPAGSTDGQNCYIEHYNGTRSVVRYSIALPATTETTESFNRVIDVVNPNDCIYFRSNRGGNDYGDGTLLDVDITGNPYADDGAFPGNVYTGPMNSGANQFATTPNEWSPWSYRFAQDTDTDGVYDLAVPHSAGTCYAITADASGRGLIDINTSTGVNTMYPHHDKDVVVGWRNTSGMSQKLRVQGSFTPLGSSTDGQNAYVQKFVESTSTTSNLYSKFLPINSSTQESFDVTTTLATNDYLFFRINRGPANDYGDGAHLSATITRQDDDPTYPLPAAMFDSNGYFDKKVPHGSSTQDYYPVLNAAAVSDFQKIREAGFKWVRMDLNWAVKEKSSGVYDFSKLLGVLDEMKANGLGAVLILDFNNPNIFSVEYFQALDTTTLWNAYGNFAKKVVETLGSDYKYVLDIWNEPNIIGLTGGSGSGYWRYATLPSLATAASHYTSMANDAITKAHTQNASSDLCGPSAASFDWPYFDACFNNSLLSNIDAVSVHPYHNAMPGMNAKDFNRLRKHIDLISTSRHIPIMCTELGTTSAGSNADQQTEMATRQAAMCAQYLAMGYMYGIPCVWYAVRDAGTDGTVYMDNLGMLKSNGTTEKDAYKAAKTFNTYLDGYTCWGRIGEDINEGDNVILFEKSGSPYRYTAWTTDADHDVVIPLGGLSTTGKDMVGTTISSFSENGSSLTLPIKSKMTYLAPGSINDTQRRWACVKAVATENHVVAGVAAGNDHAPEVTVTVRNAFSSSITGSVTITPPGSVTGSWQGSNSFSLSSGQSVDLVWRGGVDGNTEGAIKLPFVLHITGQSDTPASVWLHSAFSGDEVLAEGKSSESWEIEGGADSNVTLTYRTPSDSPEYAYCAKMTYTFTPTRTTAGLYTFITGGKDISGYGAWEFDLYVPAGGLPSGTIVMALVKEDDGQGWMCFLEPATGWNTYKIDFHEMWPIPSSGYTYLPLMELTDMAKFGITIEGANGDSSNISLKNVGVWRE